MKNKYRVLAGAVIVFAQMFVLAGGAAADFELQNGDHVVFLGDSNTAGARFAGITETYALGRYPNRNITFENKGYGGDTAAGGLARLQRDVIDEGADVVIVIYGINDILWGLNATKEARQLYLDSITAIVERCVQEGIEVYISTYFVIGGDPSEQAIGFLQSMGQDALVIAESNGGHGLDIFGGMQTVAQNIWNWNQANPNKTFPLNTDGIHLSTLGHELAAYSLITALGAPADVSSVTVNAANQNYSETGASVRNVTWDAGTETLVFERKDDGIPLTFGYFSWISTNRWIPFDTQLNRYMLIVKNLPAGTYDINVDGRQIEPLTASQLSFGANLSRRLPTTGWSPGGPWDAQSQTLMMLTVARNQTRTALTLINAYLVENENLNNINQRANLLNTKFEGLQRKLVTPTWYRFELVKQ
jgi:lysophospholipase L1-like esterase